MLDFLLWFNLVLSLGALVASLWSLRRAERPLVHAALVELADQRNLVERLLTARHNAARQQNVAGAREEKERRRSLVEEAAAVVAASGGEPGPGPGASVTPRLVAPRAPKSEAEQLIELRKRAGL